MLELTRLLYARDEVEASLMLALLKRKSVEECLFWVNELVWSGYEVRNLLWSIYYDFYAQYNPSFEKKMKKQFDKFQSGDINALFVFVKSIRLLKSSDNVFSLRMSKVPTTLTIYRGRLPKWLLAYEKECRPLARATASLNWPQLLLIWFNNSLTPPRMIETFIRALCETNQLLASQHATTEIIEALWNQNLCSYMDESHRALATMVSLMTPDAEQEQNSKLIALNQKENEFISWLHGPIPTTADGHKQNYDALLYKRYFKIDIDIGVFQLERFAFDNYKMTVINRWYNYVGTSPFWQSVFKNYQVVISSHGELGFQDDNEDKKLEAFSDDYGFVFELDDPRQKWAMEQGWAEVNCEKDIVDLMDEVFSTAEDLRIDFGDLEIDVSKKSYEKRRDVFEFEKLKMILDTI